MTGAMTPCRALRRRSAPPKKPSRQRGQGLLLMLLVLVTGAAYLLVQSLNAGSIASERARITQQALARAKEALIAYAVNDANRPGSLPCPDLNDDGSAELFSGNQCPGYLGRLPWKTLGLSDLRDGDGERLWYALSPSFRDHPSVRINSENTVGELAVIGNTPAGNVAAIVFSPGPVLARAGDSIPQDRSGGSGPCPGPTPYTSTPKCNPANYLDAAEGEDNADGNTTFVATSPNGSFNDRLLAISTDEILAPVEIRVAREMSRRLKEHFDAWATSAALTAPKGWYPWAAPFADPSVKRAGVAGTLHGLIPLEPTNVLPWNPTLEVNGVSAGTCSLSTLGFSCSTSVNAGDTVSFTADLDNLGTAFVLPPPTTSVTVSPLNAITTPGPSWTLSGASGGRLTYAVSGTAMITGTLTISGEAQLASWTQDSWLLRNEWYRVLYYAISHGFTIAGAGDCGGSSLPACVTVDNTSDPAKKHAVVLATGRAITGQTRPPANPTPGEADYLENQNKDGFAGLHFEFNRRNADFNDYVAVVSP